MDLKAKQLHIVILLKFIYLISFYNLVRTCARRSAFRRIVPLQKLNSAFQQTPLEIDSSLTVSYLLYSAHKFDQFRRSSLKLICSVAVVQSHLGAHTLAFE